MPVFRSKVRRRPARSQTRRRTSTRWAPPGRSPAAGVTLDLATFSDTFSKTTLEPWWQDEGSTPPTVAGSGLLFEPPPSGGEYTEVRSRYLFSLAGKSVTFNLSIPTATFTNLSTFIQIKLLDPVVNGLWHVSWRLYYDSPNWTVEARVGNGAGEFVQEYTTTNAVEWSYIRIELDIVNTDIVSMHRSADGYEWTLVGSHTFVDPTVVDSLRILIDGTAS